MSRRTSEYRTIVHCTEELETALQSDRAILNFLDRKGYIKPSVYEDVNNPKSLLSEDEKARRLVTGIRHKVELNLKNYHKLLKYFHKDRRMYGDIADILDKKYHCQQEGKFTLEPNVHLTSKRQIVLAINERTRVQWNC